MHKLASLKLIFFVMQGICNAQRLFFLFILPLLGEVPHHAYASCAVTSTYTTLVKLKLGANDAITPRPYTFPLHAHRAAVRTTLRPVYNLKIKSRYDYQSCASHTPLNTQHHCYVTNSPFERTPHSIRFLLLCKLTCTYL